jgi:hypothetical protein
VPNAERIFFIRHALRAGFTIEEIFNLTKIDRWFLVQIKEIVDFEEDLAATTCLATITAQCGLAPKKRAAAPRRGRIVSILGTPLLLLNRQSPVIRAVIV